MPPGSGVPVPGAKAGSSTSTSTERNAGALTYRLDDSLNRGLDAVVADLVHEDGGRCLARACQANSSSPGQ